MTELALDSTSATPFIKGEELDKWRLLKMRFSLIEASEIKSINGPKYTR